MPREVDAVAALGGVVSSAVGADFAAVLGGVGAGVPALGAALVGAVVVGFVVVVVGSTSAFDVVLDAARGASVFDVLRGAAEDVLVGAEAPDAVDVPDGGALAGVVAGAVVAGVALATADAPGAVAGAVGHRVA